MEVLQKHKHQPPVGFDFSHCTSQIKSSNNFMTSVLFQQQTLDKYCTFFEASSPRKRRNKYLLTSCRPLIWLLSPIVSTLACFKSKVRAASCVATFMARLLLPMKASLLASSVVKRRREKGEKKMCTLHLYWNVQNPFHV